MSEIKVATDSNFQELVLGSDKPVVVDFWATWCGPCRMVAPEMEKLAEKYDGTIQVVKVDVDANPMLSQAFNIMSIPTIAFFRPASRRVPPWASAPPRRSRKRSDSPPMPMAPRTSTRRRLEPRPPRADGGNFGPVAQLGRHTHTAGRMRRPWGNAGGATCRRCRDRFDSPSV